MLEFFTAAISENNAITILKEDHATVKDLFDQFEKAEDKREKKRIAAKAIKELKIHAEIEEKIFYPALRGKVEKDVMNEADEEHHVAKLLIAELEQMDGSEDHWEAKFIVLAENVRHHIKEEEYEMMPQVRHANVDLEALGEKLLAMKEKLKKKGVPPSAEEKLMKVSRGRADSPARNASLRKPAARGAAKSKNSARKTSRQTPRGKKSRTESSTTRSKTAAKRR